MKLLPGRAAEPRAGFTLVEVAVTLMIVGIGLVMVLQGLNSAQASAAHTHNRKVARELALLTLSAVESGLFWEEIDDRMFGSYGEEGYEEWTWELVLGDASFSEDHNDEESGVLFDSYRYRRELEEEQDDDDDDDEVEEPFEKVRIRVIFPKMGEFPNEVTFERWIPWVQVYGEDEDQEPRGEGDEGAQG